MSIYQITKEYLIKNFDPDCLECPFTPKHTQALNQKILAYDPTYKAVKSEKKEAIRQAFNDFYINIAKVALFFKGMDEIIVKIMPYETHPNEEKYIKEICAYVQSIAEELDKVNDNDSILIIPENYVDEMHHLLKEIAVPVNSRRMIRKAVTEAFKLDSKDLVLFMNRKIVIRFFCEATGCERRFEGLPGDEIQTIVENIYSEESENDLAADLEMVVDTLADSTLDFSRIDNSFFDTKHVKIIQHALIDFFRAKLSQEEVIIKAVANYVFRESFYFIHELLAEKLLTLVERKDKNAELFLRYYKGDVTIIGGEKYITPEIVDEEGQKWNISTIVNFVSQFAKNKATIKKKESKIRAFTTEKDDLVTKIHDSNQLLKSFKKEGKKTAADTERIVRQLSQNFESLNSGRTKQMKSRHGLEDDGSLVLDMRSSMGQNTPAYSQNFHQHFNELEESVDDMAKRVDFLNMKIDAEKKGIEEIREQYDEQVNKYDMLVIAISQVLMRRKMPAPVVEPKS